MTPEAQSSGSALINGKVDLRKGRLLIEVHSDVTSTNVPELKKELAGIIDASGADSWKTLYLDMRSARMIDSMGVNWIYAESIRLKDRRKSMVLRISSPAINRVFAYAGLNKVATIKYRRRKQTR